MDKQNNKVQQTTDTTKIASPRLAALVSLLDHIDDDSLRLIWGVQLNRVLGYATEEYYWSALKLKAALKDPDKVRVIEATVPPDDIDGEITVDDVLKASEQFPRSIKFANGNYHYTALRPRVNLGGAGWDRATDMLFPDRAHHTAKTRRPPVAVARHVKTGIPTRTPKVALPGPGRTGFAVVVPRKLG